MPFISNKFLKKTICLGLSAVLIYNTAVPAFGQEFFYNDAIPVSDKTYFDKAQQEIKADLIDIFQTEYKNKLKNDTYARAEEIKKEILGDEQAELQKELFGPKQSPKSDADYKAEYLQSVQDHANNAKEEINTRYKELLQELKDEEKRYLAEGNFAKEEVDAWKAENLTNIKSTYKDAVLKIDNYYKQETDKINNNYKEFLQELKEGAEASFYEHVKELFNELMGLYKQDPDKVKEQILELTPVITTLVNNNGQHIYTEEQRQILLKLYRKVLAEESAKVGTDKSIFTNACEIKGHCPEVLGAIMGLSVLSPVETQLSDGSIIFNTIDTYKNTAANFAVLLNGISALLVMKDYDLVRKLLKADTEEENQFHFWDNMNFMAIPKAVANVNGKYLGNISAAGAYWNDNKEYQNAYSDIAQILAEDGSKEALGILREFGVNRCMVKGTSGVKRETLSKYTVSCSGIKPFLVGALLSGKSGANQYALPKPNQATQYFGKDGRVYRQDLNSNRDQIVAVKDMENAYYTLAKEGFNGDAEAMLALHIMSEGMGDLNAQEEYSLDTTLHNAFKGRIPERFLYEKHIVIDSERLSKKENRQITRAAFLGVGLGADVFLTVYFIIDIAALGGKLLSFGKNLFNAFKMAQIGLTVKNIPALAKVAGKYTKEVFMRQKLVVKISKIGNKFKNSAAEYKNAVRLNILTNATQYTNAVHDQAALSLSFARMGGASTPNIKGIARLAVFDSELGTFTLRANSGNLGYSKQAMAAVQDILDTATVQSKSKYRVAKMFGKKPNYTTVFLEELDQVIASSAFSAEDKQILSAFFKSEDFEKVLSQANNHISNLGSVRHTSRDFTKNPLVLQGFLGAGKQKGQRLGVDFVIGEKMPAFAESIPEFASVVEENGRLVLKFLKNENEAIDLSAFKLAFESTDSFADFARASVKMGEAGKINIKFIPKEANSFWTKNFRNVFVSDKEKLFGGRGTVSILKNGKQIETGITLTTYKKYDGLKVIINDDLGGAVSVFRGAEQLPVTTTGAFFLPKYQIRNFLNFAKERGADAPWKIKLMGGMNKVNALYLQSMVSLSVASTGLVGPLSKNYPDMKMEELTFISLIFPYLLSAATPFVSPLVKKYGAIKMLKTSMYLSLGSLALPIVAGFNGFGGIQADNPFSKPSPTLLYPSALLIGLATTLTRGSYSPLIQAIGGGSGTLKAVAFKSISSFMLILPPVLGTGLDYIHPKYFTNRDGSLYLNDEGKPVQKHWFDFSFSYPVMLAIAGAALYKLQKVHFNHKIGKSPNPFTTTREFFKDVGSSYGLLFRKDLLPLTLSSALLAGAESSLLYTYSNSMANEYVRNKVHTEELVPVIALLGLNAPAFITRMKSKPLLKAMGGDNVLGYRNMLTASLASAGVGSYLLATQDDPLSFAAGLTLTSIGFSQITSSILRYGHSKLATELKAPRHIVTSWDVSYPTIYIGMSAIPYLYGAMNDRNIAGLKTENKADMVSLKNTSWQEVMGIPIAALALGSGLSYLGMHPRTALKTVNRGGLLAPLGLIAESHNPAFTTLALPKPMFKQQPVLNTFEPGFQYNPEVAVPTLKVNPDFTLQPMRK